MGYTPLFGSLTTGTLYGKWPDIGLWPIILSIADRHGVVDVTPEYLAGVTGLPLDQLLACLGRFCEPDPGSRSSAHEGRRLIPLDGRPWGWWVVNHERYREKARKMAYDSERTASGRDAERKRESRAVPRCPDASRAVPLSDSDSDSDKNKSSLRNSVELKLDSEVVQRVFDHWKQTWNHPKAKLDPKRRRVISVALKGYSEADLKTAITGYQNSPHHRGDNERQTVYDDIGLLLRDAAHIDAGLAFAAPNGRAKGLDLIFRREEEFRAYEAALEQGLSFSDQAEWDSYHARQAH